MKKSLKNLNSWQLNLLNLLPRPFKFPTLPTRYLMMMTGYGRVHHFFQNKLLSERLKQLQIGLWWRVEASSAAVFSVLKLSSRPFPPISCWQAPPGSRQHSRPVSVQTWPQELKTDSDNNLAPLLFNGFCRCLVAAKTFPLKFFFTFKIKRRI